jgi:hypothetical protein
MNMDYSMQWRPFLTKLMYSINLKDSQSDRGIMKKDFVSSIRLDSDGRYYSRSGDAKLRIFHDGWENLKYLFKLRNKIKKMVMAILYSRDLGQILSFYWTLNWQTLP